jgi:hypothetical protein
MGNVHKLWLRSQFFASRSATTGYAIPADAPTRSLCQSKNLKQQFKKFTGLWQLSRKWLARPRRVQRLSV